MYTNRCRRGIDNNFNKYMAETKMKNETESCGCCEQKSAMTCGVCSTGCASVGMYHGCGHRHFILRIFLGLFIIAAIFSIGVKIGSLTERINSQYGYDDGYGQSYRHMHSFDYGIIAPNQMMLTVPADAKAPFTTTTKK